MSGVELLAQTQQWDHMNGGDGGWMWLWGIGLMALLVILVAWIVHASTRSATPVATPPRDPRDRGREILAERLARGEVSVEEYRERLRELE